MIATKRYDALSALVELIDKRPEVSPNETFLRFLCEFEEKVRAVPRDTGYRPRNFDASSAPDLK
jgi:hypothetical protein